MLRSEFLKGPSWQAFFGEVGPAKGCDALRSIQETIVQRDFAGFKAAYVDAVSKSMEPNLFSHVPDAYLASQFSSRLSRFQNSLWKFLKPRVLEMGSAAKQWTAKHRYLGRRLGYNRVGIAYWGDQPAITNLVSIFPSDEGYLKGWKP